MMRSIRARLTLWYVGVLAAALISLSIVCYFVAERLLYTRMDASLLATLKDTDQAIQREAEIKTLDREALATALETVHYPNRTIWILDNNGKTLAVKKTLTGPELRFPRHLDRVTNAPHYYELDDDPDTAGDDSCRGVFHQIPNLPASAPLVAVVSQSDETLEDQMDTLQTLAAVGVPLTLVLAGGGGWFLARRSLAPVTVIAETVRKITAQNLEGRVPIKNPKDEIGVLSAEFNQLLDRLATAFTQQRQFMTEASHELRTPLSVMRTAAEVTLGKAGRSDAEYREALSIVKQQTGRLTQLVDGMFALARADMGQQSLHATDFYLDEMAEQVARTASVLASQKQQRVETQVAEECPYRGDEGLVRQMLLALLDNAIKYTPEGGMVKLVLENRDSRYAISVSDNGPGIPAADQPHIFDRFFRGPMHVASSNGGAGAGLGLAIARSIAELHRGQLTLERSDACGSTFLILLPRTS